MSWVSVRVRAAGSAAHATIVAALIEAGGEGVQEIGDALVTYLPGDADFHALHEAVRRESATAVVDCTAVDDTGWAEQWAPRVGVQRVGALVIAPPWRAAEAGAPERAIIIDPAMAFGTGEHPTTRGVLRLMQRIIRAGDTVADLGAGSAVLSIAAARLGARRVAAIELDADAIDNAETNIRRNDAAHRVTVIQGDAAVLLPLVAPVRVILANILSSVLVRLSPTMRDALAPDGRAVLSGILASERDDLVRALHGDGWRLEDEDREGDWWSGAFARG